MRSTTTKPVRTWDWPRTRRDDALSNDAEGSSPRQFCVDCIITTPGYDFQEGHLASWSAADMRALQNALGWGYLCEASPLPRSVEPLGVCEEDLLNIRPGYAFDKTIPRALEVQRQLIAIAGWPSK
jgi:hypothetical protein